jgi:hypothetical protein
MTNKPIVLTFTVETKQQAAALIEAYGEILDAGSNASMTITGPTVSAEVKPQAPAAPAATTGTVATFKTDNTGVPFNPDIHAPSGRLSTKGEWTLKKGVDKAKADTWKKQHAGKTTPPAAPATPSAPALNAQFGAPAWPSLPAAYPPVDYATFGGLYARLANDGKITGHDVEKIMGDTGVTDPNVFVTDDAKRAHAFALLKAFDV